MIRNFLCNLSHKPDCHLRCRKWLLLFCLLHQLCHCPITICGPVNMRSTNGICTRSWGRSHCSSLRNRLFSVTRKSSSSLWMLQSQDKEYVRWGQCESLNFFNHLNGAPTLRAASYLPPCLESKEREVSIICHQGAHAVRILLKGPLIGSKCIDYIVPSLFTDLISNPQGVWETTLSPSKGLSLYTCIYYPLHLDLLCTVT